VRWLRDEGIVGDDHLERIDQRIKENLDRAVDEAEAAPMPDPKVVLENVWSTPRWTEPHPNYHDWTKEIVP